jgi:transposase InsO family protein
LFTQKVRPIIKRLMRRLIPQEDIACFVDIAYSHLLGRPASPGERRSNVDSVQKGTSLACLVSEIESSAESERRRQEIVRPREDMDREFAWCVMLPLEGVHHHVADVSDTLLVALRGSGLNQVKVLHLPRLLSDNAPSYVSSELGKWLENNGIRHIRSRPYHPMTQGKIERYHRLMKTRILLDNYYHYNNCRYHESLDNLTPADVSFRRGQAILARREKIKRKTIEQRRRLHQQAIAV